MRIRNAQRGAANTEIIIVVTVVAVVLLLAGTIFGNKILALFTGGSKSLDRGTPFAVDTARTALDVNTDTTLANPGGTTNAEVEAARKTLADRFPITGFSESDRRRVEAAISKLPAALREAAIRAVEKGDINNAFFVPARNEEEKATRNDIEIGDFILHANGAGNVNDTVFVLRGVNPSISFEEILFHEFQHAFEFNGGAAVVKSFTDIAFASKSAAFENDPAVQAAVKRKEEIQEEVNRRAAEQGFANPDDDLDAAVFDRVFKEDPKLREEFFEVNRTISTLAEQHGFPSIFPGDKHSSDNEHEFFAVVLQIAKFHPDLFQHFREVANDPEKRVLTPEEIAFVDAHPELLN